MRVRLPVSLLVRRYRPEDRARLLEVHAAQARALGLALIFPDPELAPNFATIIVEDGGKIVAAATGRAACETFITLDPSWADPLSRWLAIKRLFHDGAVVASQAGFCELHAALDVSMAGYSRRLQRELGFLPDNRSRLVLDLADALSRPQSP
jgi:hypothetical protein